MKELTFFLSLFDDEELAAKKKHRFITLPSAASYILGASFLSFFSSVERESNCSRSRRDERRRANYRPQKRCIPFLKQLQCRRRRRKHPLLLLQLPLLFLLPRSAR